MTFVIFTLKKVYQKDQPCNVPGKKTIITVLTGYDRKTGNLTSHDR